MPDRTAEVLAALGSQEALDLVGALLDREEGASVTELAAATAYNQPKVTRLIQTLEHAGLIVRGQGEKPLALAHAEDVRRLIDQAAATALKALADEAETASRRQRRVRKTRLARAEEGAGP